MANVKISEINGGEDTTPAGNHLVEVEASSGTSYYIRLSNISWLKVEDTWAYATATTITVPSGAASLYSVGDKVKLTQTTVKYFYIVGVADTVLTVTGGSDYTVANAAITLPNYSKAASPVGFPDWFNDAVVVTGFSVDPTSMKNRFTIIGRTCEFVHFESAAGTSDQTFFTVALPVTAASKAVAWIGTIWAVTNNGGDLNTGSVAVFSGGTVASLYTTHAGSAWAAANGKRARFQIRYEI